MSVNNSLYCDPVYKSGTDAQRERFLRPAAAGHALGGFALTEPQAGSDARNQQTLAVRDGGHYVLNGRKQFVTNGREAAFVLVFCATDRAKAHPGITALVVEKGPTGRPRSTARAASRSARPGSRIRGGRTRPPRRWRSCSPARWR